MNKLIIKNSFLKLNYLLPLIFPFDEIMGSFYDRLYLIIEHENVLQKHKRRNIAA